MMNTIFTKTFVSPPVNKSEILRYSGVREMTPEVQKLLDCCLEEIKGKLTYSVCYRRFPLSICENAVNLFFTQVKSSSLKKNLEDCHSFILFAATVGIELDRLIARYGRTSPSKALMMQAIGAERIEGLCDKFTEFISEEYGTVAPRFSPGYGDFPLSMQKDFFSVLQPSRKIGLTLNSSMLMSPSKSVTAIIGISDKSKQVKNHSCSECDKEDCIFRRKL